MIKAYDDQANNTLNVSGTKVTIGLMKNKSNDNEESSSGFKSEVLDIIKNAIGKKKVIIISSQQSVPIGVYQGDEVYVTIPSDLPKMTRLNIDGKSLYMHRANYIIMDSKMLS